MHFHVIATIKFTPALGAGVRLLAMHVTMRGQMACLREGSVARLALVFAQTLVLEQMLVEKGLGCVTIVTDVTDKGLRVRVLHHMRLELGHDLEGLVADSTDVRGGVARFNVLVQHR